MIYFEQPLSLVIIYVKPNSGHDPMERTVERLHLQRQTSFCRRLFWRPTFSRQVEEQAPTQELHQDCQVDVEGLSSRVSVIEIDAPRNRSTTPLTLRRIRLRDRRQALLTMKLTTQKSAFPHINIQVTPIPTFFGSRHSYLVLRVFGGTPSWSNRYKDQ